MLFSVLVVEMCHFSTFSFSLCVLNVLGNSVTVGRTNDKNCNEKQPTDESISKIIFLSIYSPPVTCVCACVKYVQDFIGCVMWLYPVATETGAKTD